MDELDIYTSLEDAKAEIQRRWNDKELRKKVEDFLGGDNILDSFKNEPRAVLVRDIISPDLECYNFVGLAKKIELRSLFMEYPGDKFVNKNSDKYYLCKPSFLEGKNKNNEDIVSNFKIVDFNVSEGKRFNEISTIWGENLVNFHHRLFDSSELGSTSKDIVDITRWFNNTRFKSEYYYLYFLALFICHGVLFENFLTNDEEIDFTKNKVLPSFYKIEEMFGVKPLIVPVVPIEEETNHHWWCFPVNIRKYIITR